MWTVLGVERSRIAWWGVGAVAAAVLALFLYSFIGTVVLGLFFYYAARPLHRRLCKHIGSRIVAATLTMFFLILPAIALIAYTVFLAFQEVVMVAGPETAGVLVSSLDGNTSTLTNLLEDPRSVLVRPGELDKLWQRVLTGLEQLGVVATGLTHLTLALALAFFLFQDGGRLERWFTSEIGARGSAAHAFLQAIDRDLEYVYFGNVLTVLLVTGLSIVVYNVFVLLTPPELGLPFPTLLALLTGLATFVPLVVGKIIYVPLTLYLTWKALQTDPSLLWMPAVFLIVAFLLLDLLPQTVVQPLLSGRTLHTGLIMFSYILGVALFGWYGLFYGPLLVVFVIQFANIIFPELVRGETVTAATAGSVQIGTDPVDSDAEIEPGPEDIADGGSDEDGASDEHDASDEAAGNGVEDDEPDGTDERTAGR